MKSRLLAVAVTLSLAGATWAATIRNEPIQPLEAPRVTNPAEVELGKKLFFDPRLSRSGFISCNSCHNLSMGGSDNLKTSIGDKWQQGPINSSTVLNSSLAVAQFWDGRAANLQEQAGGPIANPAEMAYTHELAVETLRSIPGYVAEFKSVFGSASIDIDKITRAIAAFEETLVTPNSPFDQWLRGDDQALGGTSFQKMGLLDQYKTSNPAIGRAAVTGKDEDRMSFKVPTLRNVELTYPYFHDGEAETLEEAVDVMGRLQLGRKYTEQETADIVAFLKSLTGDQPTFVMPLLPPSANDTPRPKPFE